MPLTTAESSSQYLDYSAKETAINSQVESYLSGSSGNDAIDKANAKVLADNIAALLPQLAKRIRQVTCALRSQGRIYADTKAYGTEFSAMATGLALPVISNMRTMASSGSNSEMDSMVTSSSVLGESLDYASSSSDFYTKYSGRLCDRSRHLGAQLKNLTDTYDFFIIVYSVASSKAA